MRTAQGRSARLRGGAVGWWRLARTAVVVGSTDPDPGAGVGDGCGLLPLFDAHTTGLRLFRRVLLWSDKCTRRLQLYDNFHIDEKKNHLSSFNLHHGWVNTRRSLPTRVTTHEVRTRTRRSAQAYRGVHTQGDGADLRT